MSAFTEQPFKLIIDSGGTMISKKNVIQRIAVRAVIIEDHQIYMIYSNKFHDLKFPGGGIQKSETMEQALSREVLEETGIIIQPKIELLGEVVEYRKCLEPTYDAIAMYSYYFLATVLQLTNETNFDDYEKTYDYSLRKVTLDEAIKINSQVVGKKEIPWRTRELEVLKHLNNFLFNH